jgi:hypothetical protein
LRVIEEGEDGRRFKELKRLKKQDETWKFTLTSEERRATSTIISTPLQALGEDFNVYLRSIRELIEGADSIRQARKREQALKWIDHLLSAGLSALKDKRERLHSKIEEA